VQGRAAGGISQAVKRMMPMLKCMVLGAALIAAAAGPVAAQTATDLPVLPGGAHWAAEVPSRWNGTLLLWSRGYSNRAGRPESAPAAIRDVLLAQGYALAGSDYGSGGWALEQALPSQAAVIDAFAARYGKPRRVIAWGNSMGGLVTVALAEQDPARIDGAAAFCSSIGGSVGMMNMALDGAFAFRTLVAPDAGLALTSIADDRANGDKAGAALAAAMKTPEGRARVMLAGVLAGIPGWTSTGHAAPAPADADAQVEEIASTFVAGVFLPRGDQEARAGTGYSWNTGIDYRRQLRLSGRRGLVEALYRKAGLDLERDLARLNATPRIEAVPSAVAYMERNYAPTAHPMVPLLAVQAIGDGATSPSLQRGYAEAARGRRFASLWLRQAGHCTFSADQILGSLHYLERRLDSGSWGRRPDSFIAWRPAPMLRPHWRRRSRD